MLQLTNEHVDSIIKRISFLKTEAGDLPIMVDICKILLSAADVPIPDTYKTIVLQAGAQGIIRWDSLSRFINSGPTVSSQFVDAIEKILPTASSPGAS